MSGNRLGLAVGIALPLLVGMVATASAKEHLYVGAAKCRSCHAKELIGNQYGAWQKGPHAKAFTTLKGEKAIKLAKEKGLATPPHESPECLECHVTGHGVPAARIRYPMKASDGVQCESCHGPGNDYRKKTTMSDEKKAIAAGMWQPGKEAKICTDCHNDRSPSWDPKKFKLANGSTVGFDFEQAKEKIAHEIPKDVKGHYLELVKKKRAEGSGGGGAADDEEDEDEE
jgi:Cytochrome c554 and c-prime